MSVLIIHQNDMNKLSEKSILKIHNKFKEHARYNDKYIYLFTPENVDLSKKIYKKIYKHSHTTKIMSILFLGNNYEDAKKIYRDILISWSN